MKITKLETANGFYNMTDSMCYDSGFVGLIAEVVDGNDTYNVVIEVQGDVRVFYKGECYRCASQMPDELIEKFANGTVDYNNECQCDMNNWWEVMVYKNKVYQDDLGGFMDFCPADFTDEEDVKQYILEIIKGE